MIREDLKKLSKEEILDFIREKLRFKNISHQLRYIDIKDFQKKEHRRFEMAGYREAIKHNLDILNEFIDIGIYDYTNYLYLDFKKGHGTLFYQYYLDKENLEVDLGGYGTTEILYLIFKKTVLSDRPIVRDYL